MKNGPGPYSMTQQGDKRPIQQQAEAVRNGTQQSDDRPLEYRIRFHACQIAV